VELTPVKPFQKQEQFAGATLMSGKAEEIKARIKEAVGDLADNQDLKDSGKADKAAGKLKQGAERVIDKARDAVKKP
jgi:uncharacterized protein YjbJ (UPF0337 family)